MDFYITATFQGPDGTSGYTSGEEYELSIHTDANDPTIKIYECPNEEDWNIPNLQTFLQNWTHVSINE